jgi:hypothetical protein
MFERHEVPSPWSRPWTRAPLLADGHSVLEVTSWPSRRGSLFIVSPHSSVSIWWPNLQKTSTFKILCNHNCDIEDDDDDNDYNNKNHIHNDGKYEGVSKSFRTGRLERELQMLQLSATRCSYIAILWVSLVSFASITLYVASQRVFVALSFYFFIDSVRKLFDTRSYILNCSTVVFQMCSLQFYIIYGAWC